MTTAGNVSVQSKLTQDWNNLRHADAGWPQFLESVQLDGIRGWAGETVEFRYPVVAIAGENGSGKSTVLKACATAYRQPHSDVITLFPDDFFPSTPWETVEGVNLRFRVRRGMDATEVYLRKPTARWRGMPSRPQRRVYFQDISRTQPIDTLIGYGKIAKAGVFDGTETELDVPNRQRLSRVLKRDYSQGKVVAQGTKQVGVLQLGGQTYSNFHQGAGEDATADLVALLQDAGRTGLLIIDEVENSLHPRAQRRLITELLDIARIKRLQVLLSTHSPYVLEQLPPEARVYIQSDRAGARKVIYGVTPDYAMTLMDESDYPELYLYCEDAQSEIATTLLLRRALGGDSKRCRVVPVGPASVVKELGKLCDDGRMPHAGLGVLDGDQPEAPGCIRLPGGRAPERCAFEDLTEDDWGLVAQRLDVRVADLLDAKDDAMRLPDHHAWARRTAEVLGPTIRVTRVLEDATAVWLDRSVDESDREAFAAIVKAALP